MQLLHQGRGAACKPVLQPTSTLQTHICALGTKMECKKTDCNISNSLHKTGKISKFKGEKKKKKWWIWLFLQVWRKHRRNPSVMNQLQADREGSKKEANCSDENCPAAPGKGFKSPKRKFSPTFSDAQVDLLNAVLMLPGTTSARIWQNRCYVRN